MELTESKRVESSLVDRWVSCLITDWTHIQLFSFLFAYIPCLDVVKNTLWNRLDSIMSFLPCYLIFTFHTGKSISKRILLFYWTIIPNIQKKKIIFSTGVLFLPWGYDFAMWGSIIMYLVTYIWGSSVWKYPLTANGLFCGHFLGFYKRKFHQFRMKLIILLIFFQNIYYISAHWQMFQSCFGIFIVPMLIRPAKCVLFLSVFGR